MSSSHWKFIKWFELRTENIRWETVGIGCAVSPLPFERSGSPNIRCYKQGLIIFVYTWISIHPPDNTRAQTGAFSDGRSMVGQDVCFFIFHSESPSWRIPSIKGGGLFLMRQGAPRECTHAHSASGSVNGVWWTSGIRCTTSILLLQAVSLPPSETLLVLKFTVLITLAMATVQSVSLAYFVISIINDTSERLRI